MFTETRPISQQKKKVETVAIMTFPTDVLPLNCPKKSQCEEEKTKYADQLYVCDTRLCENTRARLQFHEI